MYKKILITGSIAYDVLLGCDSVFSDSLTKSDSDAFTAIFLAPHHKRHHGGTAANIGWNIALLGGTPLVVATLGNDGGPYRELLRERGIDVSYIETIEHAVTSTAIIGTDTVGNQLGFFHAGADAHGTWPAYVSAETSAGRPDLSEETSAGRPDVTEERDDVSYAIISPRDESVMMAAIAFCKQYGVPYVFDPGQRITSMAEDDLRRSIEGSYALIANEYEWSVISKRLNLTEENIALLTSRLFVTQGEKGVICFSESGAETVGGCEADQVVNPTGAGDALRAGLLVGLNAGWNIRDSLRLGCSMGSFAVEIEGTLIDHVDRDQVWQRAEEAYGEKLPLSVS